MLANPTTRALFICHQGGIAVVEGQTVLIPRSRRRPKTVRKASNTRRAKRNPPSTELHHKSPDYSGGAEVLRPRKMLS
jgi:hypothetical protein